MNPRLYLNVNLYFNLTVDIKVDSLSLFFLNVVVLNLLVHLLLGRMESYGRYSTYVFGARESERK